MEIIAEIGKNFVTKEEPQSESELLDNAKRLIVSAKATGADVAKFQVHTFEDEVLPETSRYEWVKRNSYSEEFWWKVIQFCREKDIPFLATPMSRMAAELLDYLGVDRWKVGSGDVLDFVLLDYIRDTGKPVILSSGMSSTEELEQAYSFLSEKVDDITILHCVSIYPCPLDKLNIHTISFLKDRFPNAKIGFSDHSSGIEGSLMAAQLGVEMIERHFTFNKNDWGPDHKASLEPQEMKELVNRIKQGMYLKLLEGHETKYIQDEEVPMRSMFRKGLYASENIKKGDIFEPSMIYAMRPKSAVGLSSSEYPRLLGTLADRYYQKYEAIRG